MGRITRAIGGRHATGTSGPWSAERRLEFIDFRLRWNGALNRSDLIEFFRISPQQASADLARYTQLAPRNLEYDKRRKSYLAPEHFSAIYGRSDSRFFLEELASVCPDTSPSSSSFIGWRPTCEIVRYPARAIRTDVLLCLLWAIRDGDALKVWYQSMRRPAPTPRWISPYALVSDGQRWHVRAWCDENRDFRDFVISRIQRVHGRKRAAASFADDEGWHTQIDIIIAPRPGLTPGQRRAIEIDFGMTRGRLTLRCRKALAFYVLRQLQLDRCPDQPPAVQPLTLVNRDELSDVIVAAQKTSASISSDHVGE